MLSNKNYNQFILSINNDLKPLLKLQDLLIKLDDSFKKECYFINRTYFKDFVKFITSYCTQLSYISSGDVTFNYLDVLEIINYLIENKKHYINLELPKLEGTIND